MKTRIVLETKRGALPAFVFATLNGLAVTHLPADGGFALTHLASGRKLFSNDNRWLTELAMETVAPMLDWTQPMAGVLRQIVRADLTDFFKLLLEDIGNGDRGADGGMDPVGARAWRAAEARERGAA